MGVMPCNRKNCENILCDRYSQTYGYICNECYHELVESDLQILEFMESDKNGAILDEVEDRERVLNNVFTLS
jgi:hypothetical protein